MAGKTNVTLRKIGQTGFEKLKQLNLTLFKGNKIEFLIWNDVEANIELLILETQLL